MGSRLFSVSSEDRLFLLQLARTENVGPISFFHLLKRYGSAKEALSRLPDVTRRNPPKIPSLDDIKREIDEHEKRGLLLVSYYDPLYPDSLRTLKDAPPFLSMSGRPELLQQTLFSIVGARNASQAGERIAAQLAEQLSANHWVIVSGLARGIDACVHRASIEKGTIAVVAGGIGFIYPPENKKLYNDIGEQGLIISEDPLGQSPHAALFPKRNRLISGLSWGVLIVEASFNSGSLLTAKYASDQGRSVFAIPGHPLDLRSRGSNKLLKDGAGLVETVDDIMSEHSVSRRYMAENSDDEYEPMSSIPVESDLYERIKQALTMVPVTIEDLSAYLSVPDIAVRIALVDMELNGEIERYPGDAVMSTQL